MQTYLAENILTDSKNRRLEPRCVSAMQDVRAWLTRISDKMMAAAVLANGARGEKPEGFDTLEYSRASLVQQHELLGLVLCRAVEKKLVEPSDFTHFLDELKKTDKYDVLLGKSRDPGRSLSLLD